MSETTSGEYQPPACAKALAGRQNFTKNKQKNMNIGLKEKKEATEHRLVHRSFGLSVQSVGGTATEQTPILLDFFQIFC